MIKIWVLIAYLSISYFLLPNNVSASIMSNNLNNNLNHSVQAHRSLQLVTLDSPEHSVLRTPAKTIQFPLDSETQQFIQDLQIFRDLKSPLGNPAGLAAPQVGRGLRIIIIQVPETAKTKRKDVYDVVPPTVLINPAYTPVEAAGESKDWEGCFSVPDSMGEVYRYNEIHYTAYTVDGKQINAIARGFLARLIQHEVGHLNAELYFDRLRPDCRFDSIEKVMKIIQATANEKTQ
ncbi:MAG: peptide deformylase [Gammaproteobacteria bacterium]|nr:MAG: peptide deformylase [Gammaproteobacteria bacterium]